MNSHEGTKRQVELGPVQETLLIPLLGRAEQTKVGSGLIDDPIAEEIVASLDYDFSKWKGRRSLIGASLRTRIFDDEVRLFLSANPSGTVIEIGAGLNTRYERIDNGRARWLEIDLPDSMKLRRHFFKESERRKMISASFLDEDWLTEVERLPSPYCFVSEAAIIYLDNKDVEPAIFRLARRFPNATFITDTTDSAMVAGQNKHDVMKTMAQASWFRWRCDDPSALTICGLVLVKSLTLADASEEITSSLPTSLRLMMRYAKWFIRKKINGYRINVFRTKKRRTK